MAKSLNFQSLDSLKPIVNVVNEANQALSEKGRTIAKSAIPDVFGGVIGAGIGGVVSFKALAASGAVKGLSAVGITSGLKAAGAIVGGKMVAGIFVLAAPVAVLAGGGVAGVAALKRKQLKEEKERLLKAAIEKHHAIISALKEEVETTKERADYLTSLNILLQQAIKELKADLGVAV